MIPKAAKRAGPFDDLEKRTEGKNDYAFLYAVTFW